MSEAKSVENSEGQVSEEDSVSLEQAFDQYKKSNFAESFLLCKEYWLLNPCDIKALVLMCDIVSKNVNTKNVNKKLHNNLKILATSENEFENNAQALFEAAYQFIEEKELELAVMLLKRCINVVPTESIVRYELGFALMQLKRFSEAIDEFEQIEIKDDDFDLQLNLTVCHSLTRNLKRAKELLLGLQKHELASEEKKELLLRKSVIKRLENFTPQTKLTLKDWVYSLYGAVLLWENGPQDLSGKPRASIVDYTSIATTLLILRGLVEKLGLEYEMLEYYSPLSRPLAEALAKLMDLKAEPYGGPAREERALLMMCWASDIVGPHRSFVPHSHKRSLFAYGLTDNSQLPVTPDIIGCLASICEMPWAKQLEDLNIDTEKNDSKNEKYKHSNDIHPMNQIQAEASDNILERASDLESNPQIIEKIEILSRYYLQKKEMILIGNPHIFAERAEYTAEIPN